MKSKMVTSLIYCSVAKYLEQMQILYPFKVFMPLQTCSVLLAFKNAFKRNKAFPQRFAGDLQAFMANALFCQLNMTSPHLANGNGVEKW